MNSELIQLKGVTKRFGTNVVLDNVDLNIAEKQITGIIGASGMGKSTILKLLIGFYKPSKGDVLYLKRNVYRDLKHIKRKFGFSTEDGSFYEDLTVQENVYHFGNLYRMKRSDVRSRAKELLDFVGLSGALHTKARNLSVGMKKRLDIACSMIHDPEVLILDEPTADLDPLLRTQILSLLSQIKSRGTTIVFTTQLLGEIDKICDRVAILHRAKIVEEGTPAQIKAKFKSGDLDDVFGKIFSREPVKKSKKESVPGREPAREASAPKKIQRRDF